MDRFLVVVVDTPAQHGRNDKEHYIGKKKSRWKTTSSSHLPVAGVGNLDLVRDIYDLPIEFKE